MKKKTVLLTGARGRLGSEIRRFLPDDRLQVVSFSRARGEAMYSLEDLMTPGLWDGAATIVHAAWSTVPVLSERNIGSEWQQDLPLLVQILRSVGVRNPKPHFIFFSSGGTVYGDAKERPNKETDPLQPKGWHGFAKVQAEKYIEEFCTKLEIPFTIIRISNPYGYASPSEKPQGIIPNLIQAALQDQTFRIWGDGKARKDFLHAFDFVEAMRSVISRQVVGTFNLSYGASHSLREIIEKVEQLLDRKLTLEYTHGFNWDVTDSRLDNTKLAAAIDWQPKISLEQGLVKSLELLMNKFGPPPK